MEIEESMSLSRKTLSVRLERKNLQDDFRFHMLQENTVACLLPMQRLYDNRQVCYLYDTTEKKSLISLSAGRRFRLTFIQNFMMQVLTALVKAREYYLDEDSFMVSPQYIYVDTEEEHYFFCYCPDYEASIREQMTSIMTYLMNQVDYEDLEAVKLVYQLYQLVGEVDFSASKILEIVRVYTIPKEKSGIATSTPELIRELQNIAPTPVTPQKSEMINNNIEEEIIPPFRQEPSQESIRQTKVSKETESKEKGTEESLKKGTLVMVLSVAFFLVLFCVCYGAGLFYTKISHMLDVKKLVAFVVIAGAVEIYVAWCMFGKTEGNENKIKNKQPDDIKSYSPPMRKESTLPLCYHLIPCQGEADSSIMVNHFPFSVGKDETQVDQVIQNPKISRVHAVFTREGNELILNDSHSLNGTYVNNSRLKPCTSQRIKVGDYISFANLVYQLSI